MALIPDPNWTGPGRGPLIEVPDVPPARDFAQEIADAYAPKEAAYGLPVAPLDPEKIREAEGYYGDAATSQYIRDLAAGVTVGDRQPGAGTLEQREKALNILIQQGKAAQDARDAAEKARFDAKEAANAAAAAAAAATSVPSGKDAFLELKVALEELGLTGLDGSLRDLLARGITKSDDVLFYLRDTEQYKTRFRANEGRKQKGLTQLLPAAYVALEQRYRETLIANGFDPTLYDQYTDFEKLIAGDVSSAELQNRINEGYRQVADADPEVVRQMRELYNVDSAQLAQYFLDPARTLPKLKQQAAAANVAARAKEQGKIQLTPLTAEELVSRGYSEAQAQQAFTNLSDQAGLYQEMAGERGLTQTQKIGAAFGYDAESAQEIEQRGAKRKAVFQGGGQFAGTTGATSNVRTTGLGMAE